MNADEHGYFSLNNCVHPRSSVAPPAFLRVLCVSAWIPLFHRHLPDRPLPAAVGAEVDVVAAGVPHGAVVPAPIAGELDRLAGAGEVDDPDVEVVALLLV